MSKFRKPQITLCRKCPLNGQLKVEFLKGVEVQFTLAECCGQACEQFVIKKGSLSFEQLANIQLPITAQPINTKE